MYSFFHFSGNIYPCNIVAPIKDNNVTENDFPKNGKLSDQKRIAVIAGNKGKNKKLSNNFVSSHRKNRTNLLKVIKRCSQDCSLSSSNSVSMFQKVDTARHSVFVNYITKGIKILTFFFIC